MDTKNLNSSVTNINNIRFDDAWKGSAADNQIDSLNSFMDDFNKCVQDMTAFDAVLLLRDQYIKICDRIKELDALISGCSVDHDDPDSSCRCGEYANEIQMLEQQREDLRNTIIGLLGQFTGIDPEVDGMADLTTFDNVSPDELEVLGAFNGEFPLYDQNDYAHVEYYASDKSIATLGLFHRFYRNCNKSCDIFCSISTSSLARATLSASALLYLCMFSVVDFTPILQPSIRISAILWESFSIISFTSVLILAKALAILGGSCVVSCARFNKRWHLSPKSSCRSRYLSITASKRPSSA